jgi:predicted nucleotidyltransferase
VTKGWKIAAIGAVVLLIAVALVVIDRRSRKENAAEAPAQVVGVQRTSTGSGTNRRRQLRVHYRYQVAGAYQEGTKIASATEDWSTSSPVKVCYNPDNPRHHRLERASFRCGS